VKGLIGIGGAIALCLVSAAAVQAQTQSINDLKGRIFDAKMAKQTFANGLKFCGELDGNNFYFAPRDRVLNLEEFHRSLRNLTQEHVFNPETRLPWTEQDAAARWERAKQEAAKDKDDCALVASLPDLEKRLEQMETTDKASGTAEKKN
jgi:hypothetical protein